MGRTGLEVEAIGIGTPSMASDNIMVLLKASGSPVFVTYPEKNAPTMLGRSYLQMTDVAISLLLSMRVITMELES